MHISMQGCLLACSTATTNNSQASIAVLSANQTAPTGWSSPLLPVAALDVKAPSSQPCTCNELLQWHHA